MAGDNVAARKYKWDSTKPLTAGQSLHDYADGKNSINSSFDQESSVSPDRLQRRLVRIHDVEQYCKPQSLSLYRPNDSGFRYNVLGLFGIPDAMNPEQPCVYTVLASVFPPGEPYKVKPNGSMFGANFFTDIDFERSMDQDQFFKQNEPVELSGLILRLLDHSILVLDIKRMDLRTGQISDYGFAIQPLMHKLKERSYLIGGRYQMPVYQGSIPEEILQTVRAGRNKNVEKPRLIFKKLVDSGAIQ